MTPHGQQDAPVVLVTGASGAVGFETAVHLASCGFRVYATMRRPNRQAALEAEGARVGGSIRVLQMDLTDPASIRNAMAAVVSDAGSLFAVVNNAGLYMRGFFEDLSAAEIRDVFNTNVFGTMTVVREALPYMRAAGRGRIIIISSVAGRSGSAIASAYCASKFALEGFAESLSLEVRPFGIQTVIIEPAILRSRAWGGTRGDARRARDPRSDYAPLFSRAAQLMDSVARSSPTTERHVARAVAAALASPHPKLRYMIGWRARLVFAARRYVPGELVQRLFERQVVRKIAGPIPPLGSQEVP